MKKNKELKNLNKNEAEKKIKELKMELVKAEVSKAKAGTSKIKQIKRMIAQIITLDKQSMGVKK
jgi:ribosomal protein L29